MRAGGSVTAGVAVGVCVLTICGNSRVAVGGAVARICYSIGESVGIGVSSLTIGSYGGSSLKKQCRDSVRRRRTTDGEEASHIVAHTYKARPQQV